MGPSGGGRVGGVPARGGQWASHQKYIGAGAKAAARGEAAAQSRLDPQP